jgi:EAL domain-containing protein (putative c-di-GMP-specific phosphodiesterase class I)
VIKGKDAVTIEEVMSHPEQIKFAFQPIFVVETNSIYGYEALMRPEPYSPMEVIADFAKKQRLNEIEEITTYYGAYHFLKNNLQGKLFLNSFPAAFVGEEMMKKVHELCGDKFKNKLVIEILEYTNYSAFAHQQKIIQFKESRASEEYAIDDFGTGKNIDTQCIEFYKPDIVKIDHKIISNIDTDVRNQKALIDILEMSLRYGVTMLAEGVETEAEFNYLKNYPVKLMQGFYLGKPQVYE